MSPTLYAITMVLVVLVIPVALFAAVDKMN